MILLNYERLRPMRIDQNNSDAFLFMQLQAGSEKAFDHLFRSYYKPLCLQANRLVDDQHEAESIVQDCFVKFWENRVQIKSVENLSSYLFFMVRNLAIDHLRRRKKVDKTPLDLAEIADEGTDDPLNHKELENHLWPMVANLPDRCRIAFEYSRIEGLTYPQIAVKMNISVKAVEALIGRSLKILRANLVEFLSLTLLFLRLF